MAAFKPLTPSPGTATAKATEPTGFSQSPPPALSGAPSPWKAPAARPASPISSPQPTGTTPPAVAPPPKPTPPLTPAAPPPPPGDLSAAVKPTAGGGDPFGFMGKSSPAALLGSAGNAAQQAGRAYDMPLTRLTDRVLPDSWKDTADGALKFVKGWSERNPGGVTALASSFLPSVAGGLAETPFAMPVMAGLTGMAQGGQLGADSVSYFSPLLRKLGLT